uniref:C-type lectin domain-containing protein n=1 Tax=Panagrolaimus sp. ES5 TaxID=591445 RepID=A0AC34FAF4_9BILA
MQKFDIVAKFLGETFKLNNLNTCIIFGYVKSDCENGALQSIVNSSICYSFVSEPSEFIEAEISCQSSGGHLASISDGFTNVLLAQYAKKTLVGATDFWIGGQDLGKKDTWIWVDGANFTYTNWAPEEPVELPGFDCLGLTIAKGLWYTYDCYKLKPYVCEIPPTAPLPTAGTQAPRTTTPENVMTTLFIASTIPPSPIPTTTFPDVVISTASDAPETTSTLFFDTTTGKAACPASEINTGPCIENVCPQGQLCINGQCCCYQNC